MDDKFELKRGRWTKRKDPQSDLFYRLDLSGYLAAAGTSLQSLLATTAQGVVVTVPAVIADTKIVVKLSGLDTGEGALNFCRFELLCVNTEKFEATLWFERYEG